MAKVAATGETSPDTKAVTETTKKPAGRARAPRVKRNGTGASAAGPLPTLRILDTRVLRGPNYWSRQPVVKLLVDLGVLEQFPSTKIPGFVDGLLEWIPSLEDHACSLNCRGEFVTRLNDGTWVGHIAEHIALELQNLAGTFVHHGKTRSTGDEGQYNVIYEFREEAVGLEAGKLAVRIVNHLVAPSDPEQAIDYLTELESLIRLAERQAFGPSTQAIIDEAASRDIPFLRLDRHSLVQLGHGVHQQRIRATMTSVTSAIGVDIATRQEPHQPAPRLGGPARAQVGPRRHRRGHAFAAAHRIGFPCVVKPLDGNHGRGVHLNLRSDDDVRRAFEGARRESRSAATSSSRRSSPATTTAAWSSAARSRRSRSACRRRSSATARRPCASSSTTTNADPRRGIGHEKVLTRISVNEAAEELVKAQGFELDGVPPEGRTRQARADGQHVDRRDGDRSHGRGPPGQRRDRRDGRARRRARRRRHRLHLPRHHGAGARDRRRDRRGQRGARLPHAHPPDRGRAAVRRQARHRPAVPARRERPHPDPRRHRHERQDDDGPDDRPHPQAHGAASRHDLDRWDRGRRADDPAGRHERPEVGADDPPEPDGRYRACSRSPAAGSCARASASTAPTWRWSPT